MSFKFFFCRVCVCVFIQKWFYSSERVLFLMNGSMKICILGNSSGRLIELEAGAFFFFFFFFVLSCPNSQTSGWTPFSWCLACQFTVSLRQSLSSQRRQPAFCTHDLARHLSAFLLFNFFFFRLSITCHHWMSLFGRLSQQ